MPNYFFSEVITTFGIRVDRLTGWDTVFLIILVILTGLNKREELEVKQITNIVYHYHLVKGRSECGLGKQHKTYGSYCCCCPLAYWMNGQGYHRAMCVCHTGRYNRGRPGGWRVSCIQFV